MPPAPSAAKPHPLPNSDLPVRIYSPEPALKHPRQFFADMFSDIRASGELSFALARRDFSAKYRQSLLGYVWAFLPVLGTTFVFLFLRSGRKQPNYTP